MASAPAPPAWQLAPRDYGVVDSVVGADFGRRNCVRRVDEATIAFLAGNAVRLLDVEHGTYRMLLGRDGGGIGGVAVHPSGAVLAVAEKVADVGTRSPAVYLYGYPSLRTLAALSGGTERAYADVGFR